MCKNRWFVGVAAAGFVVSLGCWTSLAAPLNVSGGTQITVYPGQVYDYATVQSNGVLIMSGGAIGTNSAPTASVTIAPGGRFYMNAGRIQYFDNRGIAELYGGAQSTDASENRGYVKIAGYDPGIQLVHFAGTVDVYYLATNRTLWEIYSVVTDGAPAIRFFSLTNTLAAGTYTYGTLPTSNHPAGRIHTNHALLWNPLTNKNVRTEILIATNWLGSVSVQPYSPLSPIAITCGIQEASTPQVVWNSVSGRTYQVEAAWTLGINSWFAAGVPMTATGSTTAGSVPGSPSPVFYRVWLRH